MRVRSQFWSSAWYCLLIEAAALLIWWPRSNMVVALLEESKPGVIKAVIFMVVLINAFLATRLGAGEFDDLPATKRAPVGFRAWLVSSRDGRALCYSCGFVVASLPIVAIAVSISEINVAGVGLVLLLAVVQALFYIALGGVAGHIGGGDLRLTRYISFAFFLTAFALTSTHTLTSTWSLIAVIGAERSALISSVWIGDVGAFVCLHVAGALLINWCLTWLRWRRERAPEEEVSAV
jgi:hypothetical protein